MSRRDPWAGTPYRPPTAGDTARTIGRSLVFAAMEVASDALDAAARAAAGTVLDRTSAATERMQQAVSRAREKVRR